MMIWRLTLVLTLGSGIFLLLREKKDRPITSTIAETASALVSVSPKPAPAAPIPSWSTPQTIKTLNGQIFRNVTIRNLTSDGGIIIMRGSNAVKIPGNLIPRETMKAIIGVAPGSVADVTYQPPITIPKDDMRTPHSVRRSR